MTQPTTPEKRPSNFAAFLNREKVAGDRTPIFVDGRISKPNETDELPFALWPFEYADKQTGEVRMGFQGPIGSVSLAAPAMDQLQSLLAAPPQAETILETNGLTVEPRRIVLFANTPKPDGAANQKTHYGYVNFGDGTPIVEVSAWLGKDRYGRAMLTGNTQFQLTPEQRAALKAAPGTQPKLSEFEPTPPAAGPTLKSRRKSKDDREQDSRA